MEEIKALRDQTGISVMQCKKALEEAKGDVEKALILLRKKGSEIAAKKSDRTLGAGVVQAYIHAGSVGAMIELSCETDFVAKNEDFKKLAYEIAMQVAATNPLFLRYDEVTDEAKTAAREVFTKEIEGKPEDMKEKIMEGKLMSYFGEKVLLEQAYIKDPKLTITNLIESAIQKFGEKIEVTRFVRFDAGRR